MGSFSQQTRFVSIGHVYLDCRGLLFTASRGCSLVHILFIIRGVWWWGWWRWRRRRWRWRWRRFSFLTFLRLFIFVFIFIFLFVFVIRFCRQAVTRRPFGRSRSGRGWSWRFRDWVTGRGRLLRCFVWAARGTYKRRNTKLLNWSAYAERVTL